MISPLNYHLEFEPNFKDFTFYGKEFIEIKIPKENNSITLNEAELKIRKCYLETKNKKIKATTKLQEKK